MNIAKMKSLASDYERCSKNLKELIRLQEEVKVNSNEPIGISYRPLRNGFIVDAYVEIPAEVQDYILQILIQNSWETLAALKGKMAKVLEEDVEEKVRS